MVSKAGRRGQALSRRIGDRITIELDNASSLSIDQDFFIESILHHWKQGNKLWEVTYECSPAE
jgi:hypothetical protein